MTQNEDKRTILVVGPHTDVHLPLIEALRAQGETVIRAPEEKPVHPSMREVLNRETHPEILEEAIETAREQDRVRNSLLVKSLAAPLLDAFVRGQERQNRPCRLPVIDSKLPPRVKRTDKPWKKGKKGRA